MNCDDAFDQMTSPSPHDNAQLRRHMSRCANQFEAHRMTAKLPAGASTAATLVVRSPAGVLTVGDSSLTLPAGKSTE